MTTSHEPLTHLLARLPDAEADPRRAARVQARCRTVLARREAREARRQPRRIESLFVVSLCLAYLVTVIRQALQ
jgi:hypothetical protein